MWSCAGSSGASGERAHCPAKIFGMRWMGMREWWRRRKISAIRYQRSGSRDRKAKLAPRRGEGGAIPPLWPPNGAETRKRLTQGSQRAQRTLSRETQDPGTHSVARAPGRGAVMVPRSLHYAARRARIRRGRKSRAAPVGMTVWWLANDAGLRSG